MKNLPKSRYSNSRLHFSPEKNFLKCKSSQAEVVTTVLLILIGIIAVVLVGAFIINLVRNNLKGTDCFDVANQIQINSESSFYNASSIQHSLYIGIERESKEFKLMGIIVSYGHNYMSKTVRINEGVPDSYIFYMNNSGNWVNTTIHMPIAAETRTYIIFLGGNSPYADIGNITKVSITPILESGECSNKIDEKEIASVS